MYIKIKGNSKIRQLEPNHYTLLRRQTFYGSIESFYYKLLKGLIKRYNKLLVLTVVLIWIPFNRKCCETGRISHLSMFLSITTIYGHFFEKVDQLALNYAAVITWLKLILMLYLYGIGFMAYSPLDFIIGKNMCVCAFVIFKISLTKFCCYALILVLIHITIDHCIV